jgi:hypothetical protein
MNIKYSLHFAATYFSRFIPPSMVVLQRHKNIHFYAFVRQPDDGRIRRPKQVAAKYNECIIFIVLCYSDPIIDIQEYFLVLDLSFCNLSLHTNTNIYRTLILLFL